MQKTSILLICTNDSNFYVLVRTKKMNFQEMTSLVVWMVKCLPTMWETRVWSLGGEDPLEKEMATHSSIICLENPMDGGA